MSNSNQQDSESDNCFKSLIYDDGENDNEQEFASEQQFRQEPHSNREKQNSKQKGNELQSVLDIKPMGAEDDWSAIESYGMTGRKKNPNENFINMNSLDNDISNYEDSKSKQCYYSNQNGEYQNQSIKSRFSERQAVQNDSQYQSLSKLRNFMSKIGNYKTTPISEVVLKTYTNFRIHAINQKINFVKIQKYIWNRNKILIKKRSNKKWDFFDHISLFWVVSKMCQFQGYEHPQQLTKKDYEQIDEIFCKADIPTFDLLNILIGNRYTDKWTQVESQMLFQIGTKFQLKGQMNYEAISKELQLRNKQPKRFYRCHVQCQRQYKLKRCNTKNWTKQEDHTLLKFVYDCNEEDKVDWKFLENYFSFRTHRKIKERYYSLLEKCTALYPYSQTPTKMELIKKKLNGEINIPDNITSTEMRKIKKQFRIHQMQEQVKEKKKMLAESSVKQQQNIDRQTYKKPAHNSSNKTHYQHPVQNDQKQSKKQQISNLIAKLEHHIVNAMNTLQQIKIIEQEQSIATIFGHKRDTLSNKNSIQNPYDSKKFTARHGNTYSQSPFPFSQKQQSSSDDDILNQD